MEMFYNGLNAHTRMVVDAFANGTFLDKSYNQANEILEMITKNDYQYPTMRLGSGKRAIGAMKLDAITSLTTQVSFIANMIRTMQRSIAAKEVKITDKICVYYGGNHDFEECHLN